MMDFLEKIWGNICAFVREYVAEPFLHIQVKDIFDILLLAVVFYQIYRFFRHRRAGRVLVGLCAVVIASVIVSMCGLTALGEVIRLVGAAAFFCIIVIFQPEIRDALERLGNLTVFTPGSNTISRKKLGHAQAVVSETVDAVMEMSKNKTGALIVFEGLTGLEEYVQTGTAIDAEISSKLLQNIFYSPAPLHDGAMVIRGMRILAASCVLPSSTRKNIDFGNMGTRHRAAVGITEVSDALVIVISEQTGTVSVAQDGKLIRKLDAKTLTDVLMTYLAGNAYLRIKKANMRKEYLEMLENVARVEPPVMPKENEEIEKEFEKIISSAGTAEGEEDSSMESATEDENNPLGGQVTDEPADKAL